MLKLRFPIAALFSAVVFGSAMAQDRPPGYGPAHAVTPELKDENRHKEFLARIKEGPVKLLFLGDSITDFWRNRGQSVWSNFEKYQPANFGVSGDRTEHVLWRLNHGELDGINPDVTVIMIGTNNIGNRVVDKPEWAAAGVRKIVDTVHLKLPRTKILLLAVFPRDKKDSEKRKLVEEINKRISQLGDRSYVEYLDIGKSFLDENGEIPADIMPDGLHPNEKGYQLWYDAMSPTLESMMAR